MRPVPEVQGHPRQPAQQVGEKIQLQDTTGLRKTKATLLFSKGMQSNLCFIKFFLAV